MAEGEADKECGFGITIDDERAREIQKKECEAATRQRWTIEVYGKERDALIPPPGSYEA